MSLHRLLLRRLSSIAASRPIFSLTQTRSYAFSSAEEAAAERRRRKRRLRIEPPLNAIRPPPQQGPPRDPNAPRHLTKGLIQAGRISEVVDLLREMLTKGHGADSLVYNNLISGFIKLENLEKVNELFDELKERCLVYDGVVNSTFMEWFFKKGRDKEAMESYRSLLERQFRMTPATCNVLLECLLKHARKTEAWALFDHMLDNHTPPNFQAVNSDTFNLMVNECFKLGNFEEALATFKKVGTKPNSKPFAMDVAGYNNIIARFCENGMLSQAETLFEELCSKSLRGYWSRLGMRKI